MVLTSSTFELSARTWLQFLASAGQKPNVLIICSTAEADEVVRQLLRWCSLPLRYYALPSALRLPPDRRGTLLVQPIEALTLTQQIALYDWMNHSHDGPQVVSVATRPLTPLVRAGRFLEGLFHRLKQLTLEARHEEPSSGERLEPPEDEYRVH